MGKTAQGAVWLAADRLSPYDYWQFWRNTEDADVGRFLRLFTDLPLDEIARLERLEGSEINEAKKVLATEATALCHGREAAEAAAATARRVFAEGGTGDELPTIEVPRAELERGIAAIELLVQAGWPRRRARRGASSSRAAPGSTTAPSPRRRSRWGSPTSATRARSSCRPARSGTRW